MVRVILTLHFYRGNEFLGQKMQWVEVPTTGALGALIDLLAHACQPDRFHGTEQFPTESDEFKCIKHELGLAYQNPYYHPADSSLWQATNVRVVQVQEGWPLKVPRVLMLM